MMAPTGRPERVRLMETYRNLFYTPIYVAVAGGFLYQHGLDVMFSTVPEGVPGLDLLKSGQCDILQTGISRSLMDLDQGHDDAPLYFAEINQRDGFFLISRSPTDGWTWKDLEGATLIPIGFTPVPWMTLRYALKKRGVDIGKVRLLPGLGANEALARFRSGGADYIHMVNPFAQQLVHDGDGYLAAAIGPELGYLCYSSFAATPAFVESRPDTIHKFVRGFLAAQRWLAGVDVAAIADRVAPFFPATPRAVLEQSIRRYREQRTWSPTPHIGVEGYDTMRDILVDGGLVKNRWPYDRLVRPQFAEEAMQG